MVTSVLTQVWSYIVIDNLNLIKNPCTTAHHISLYKNTICRLTIVQWGGNEGKEYRKLYRKLYRKEKTGRQEFTDIKC